MRKNNNIKDFNRTNTHIFETVHSERPARLFAEA